MRCYMYHHKLGSLPSLSLLFSFVVVFTVTPVKANRVCWSTDCVTGDDWCIQTCSLDHDEFSCLALYRRNTAGENVASFFGCHNNPCDKECDPLPVEGVASNFACCCSGDLCNVVPGLTPTGDEPTAPPNPESPPTANPHDDVMVCEVYECGENPDNCYNGYMECPSNASYCQAEYAFGADNLYHLTKKSCTTNEASWCDPRLCRIDTDGDHTRQLCCCGQDLCNVNVLPSSPEKVDMGIVDPCEDMNCNHSCIVHDDVPRCFCDFGHVLSDDKKTCVDLDECNHNNGNCGVHCINEIGTGYHCGCPDDQKLRNDGFTCEETGLICHSLSCNGTGIGCRAPYVNQYCDDVSPSADRSRHHCQATYKLRDDGTTFEPRLLSCFEGDFPCMDDSVCYLEPVGKNVYYCCCQENYCNGHEVLVFPNVTEPPVTSSSHLHDVPSSTSSAEPSETPTTVTSDPDDSMSQSKLTFIIVVVLSPFLLIPIIAVGVACTCYMYCTGPGKRITSIDLKDPEQVLHSPDLAFRNLSFIDKIGQGRFAAVWRAKNIEDVVAVKVFANTSLSYESWLRECEIYKTPELEHKYILSFRGSRQKETELWIVTDYYHLGSLHDLLKKQTLSLKQFCDLAESAAVGLAHLHDQRIVDGFTKKPSIAHRDLKSKNILVQNDYTCVISDFGLAIKFLNEETSSDAHGQVGTSRYMAPEVLEGAISFQREAYLRIDVYAFALILWELASRTSFTTGSMKQYRPPFDEYVSSNPSIEEMRDVVVTQFKRPTIPKGFTTSGEYDSLRDTIEESWDQEPEARLSAQCIAERIRTFKLSKFGSKDSGLTDSNSPADLTYNSESIDSQLAPTTPSLTSSGTMSPLTSKCLLDSGTESIGVYQNRAFSKETVRLGTMSSNSSFLPFRNRNSANFDHNFGGSTVRCNHPSNRAMYSHSLHSTETTV